MKRDPRFPWARAFDGISAARGDTEAANRYVSVKNFVFVRSCVLAILGAVRRADILDVGCGTGHFAAPLAAGNRVVGLDLSRNMLSFARNKGLFPVQAEAEHLPFASGRFDIVLANSVLQLVPDGESLVRDAVRVVRPGGRIVLTTINVENAALPVLRRLERKKYEHFRLYPWAELRALLDDAGGQVKSTHYLYFPLGRKTRVAGDARAGRIPRKLASTLIVEASRRA